MTVLRVGVLPIVFCPSSAWPRLADRARRGEFPRGCFDHAGGLGRARDERHEPLRYDLTLQSTWSVTRESIFHSYTELDFASTSSGRGLLELLRLHVAVVSDPVSVIGKIEDLANQFDPRSLDPQRS
jgi:hypothetical protein